MKIYAADDEHYMLKALKQSIEEVLPEAEVDCFTSSRKLYEAFINAPCDIVFLDIEMPGMTGVELAGKLEAIKGDINIFFTTGYDQYKSEAMDLHACDYITKPVTADKIAEAVKYIRYPIPEASHVYRAVTFGNFTLYVDKKPVTFHRKKSAEILAYLVDKRGTIVTRNEITLAVFEDESHSRKSQKYLSSALKTLEEDLKSADAQIILHKGTDGLAINMEVLQSDLYEYLDGKESLYKGEYMEQYSWGEYLKAKIDNWE